MDGRQDAIESRPIGRPGSIPQCRHERVYNSGTRYVALNKRFNGFYMSFVREESRQKKAIGD